MHRRPLQALLVTQLHRASTTAPSYLDHSMLQPLFTEAQLSQHLRKRVAWQTAAQSVAPDKHARRAARPCCMTCMLQQAPVGLVAIETPASYLQHSGALLQHLGARGIQHVQQQVCLRHLL